jgi:hypothetical protein
MKNIFLLMIIAILAGCSEKVQTVDWYKEHEAERKEMIAKCKADPGRLMESANCINAQQAENQKANARRGWVIPNAIDFGKKGN